jgi:hypothetical protein
MLANNLQLKPVVLGGGPGGSLLFVCFLFLQKYFKEEYWFIK